MNKTVTALVADDEPLLRDALVRLLAKAWPELDVIAQARNGREAIEMFEGKKPQVCFLDVQMPGITGVEAAREIGDRAHLVFVTAFQQYAVQAFERGALDYLVKPVETERLAETVRRLRARIDAARPASENQALIQQLAQALNRDGGPQPLKWVRASVGNTVRIIDVESIDYFRSDEKYTTVAYRDESAKPLEAVVRLSLKDLLARLDAQQFAQVHRSVVVNLKSVRHVARGEGENADIHLKGRDETLPVSRTYLHLFRQM